MATSENNFILRNVRGQLGKQIVIKHYGDKIVITAYPDMSKIKPSKKQRQKRTLFAEAVAYAKAINADPERKELYKAKVKKGQTVYHFAIREFMNGFAD